MEKLPPRELVSSKNEYNNAIFTVFHFRSLFKQLHAILSLPLTQRDKLVYETAK